MFSLFRKKKPEVVINKIEKKIDYASLVPITEILTEGDSEALRAIQLLVDNPLAFSTKFEDWLIEYDFSPELDPDIITAYLLTGKSADSPYDFGGYIDWKEGPSGIIWSLETSVINKRYELNLNEIVFSKNENGYEALVTIANYLLPTPYALVDWAIGGDCYNIFIVPRTKLNELELLASQMDIDIGRI